MASGSNSLRNWILGIVAAVATPVLIFVIEQKLTEKPTATPTHTFVSVNGQVFDAAAKQLLENVEVRLQLASVDQKQATDSLGRYAFSVEDFDLNVAGTLSLDAPGYKPLRYNLSLQKMTDMQDVTLQPLPVPPPTGVGAVVDPAPANRKPVMMRPAAIKYVPRIDARRISALAHP